MPKLDAMGLVEVAAHFGVTKSYARKLSERRDWWPEGLKLSQGWIWDAEDVRRWGREHPEIGRKNRPAEGEPDAG